MSALLQTNETNKRPAIKMAGDIRIPKEFNMRLRTNTAIDDLFGYQMGGGICQAGYTLLSGERGTGKTTALMQLAHLLTNAGQKVLVNTTEQSKEGLAFTAKRLNTPNIMVSDIRFFDDLLSASQDFDLVILDSIPGIRVRHPDYKTRKSQLEYVHGTLTHIAEKQFRPFIGVLHSTVDGRAKGGTDGLHACHVEIELRKGSPRIYGDDTSIEFRTKKNRYGATIEMVFKRNQDGFDFMESSEIQSADDTKLMGDNDPRLQRKRELESKMIELIKEQIEAKIADFNPLCADAGKVKRHLKDLADAGTIERVGRGNNAFWRLVD
jgi:predicted ATP-dependent serine protease